MNDCRTCRHNTYARIKDCDYFDCSHPVTEKKRVEWRRGDPTMVAWRTADVALSDIHHFADCPAWEPQP